MGDYDPTDLDRREADGDERSARLHLAAENEDSDFAWLMSGPRGRRIVRRLLEHAGVFRSSFSPNSMHMAHLEGAKQVGYWILGQIERVCPEGYHTMMQETRNGRTAASHRSTDQN